MHRPFILVFCLVFALTVGCTPLKRYDPPTSSPANASIVGSKIEMPGLQADIISYVNRIDGGHFDRFLSNSLFWDSPVFLTPERHHIDFGVKKGDYYGHGQADCDFEPGVAYTVRTGTPVAVDRSTFIVDAWVEAADGHAVSERTKVVLRRATGGPGYVPIIVPRGR